MFPGYKNDYPVKSRCSWAGKDRFLLAANPSLWL